MEWGPPWDTSAVLRPARFLSPLFALSRPCVLLSTTLANAPGLTDEPEIFDALRLTDQKKWGPATIASFPIPDTPQLLTDISCTLDPHHDPMSGWVPSQNKCSRQRDICEKASIFELQVLPQITPQKQKSDRIIKEQFSYSPSLCS